MLPASTELDVRPIPPQARHRLVFRTFDELPVGEAFTLIVDHDPRPLYYQFRHERADVFSWLPLERGPEVWRVRITRRPPRSEECDVGAWLARDHDEMDVLLGNLRDDLRSCEGRPSGLRGAVVSLFEEFDQRLERHLRWEREHLFPAVEQCVPGMADREGADLREGQAELRRLKGRLRSALTARPESRESISAATAAAEQLAAALEKQERFEEETCYPLARRVLRPEDECRLLTSLREAH